MKTTESPEIVTAKKELMAAIQKFNCIVAFEMSSGLSLQSKYFIKIVVVKSLMKENDLEKIYTLLENVKGLDWILTLKE